MTHLPKLRMGIVGAGIMGRGHAEVLSAHPDVEITAVSRRRLDDAPDAAVFADYTDLLSSGTVDAVSITTPDHLHADVMVAAARAGVHILVEKPFTTTVEDADRAVAAIRQAGVTAMCLFNHRWVPAYAQAKERMPLVGEPVVGYARKDDTIHVPTEMIGWADRTTCAWFLSSHDIDLVTWLYDDHVDEVFATARYGKLRGMGIETPDAMQIQARFGRGAVATFESAWIYPNTFPTMVDSYVTVVGESGVIQLDRQKENIQLATDQAYSYPRNMLQRVVHGVPAGAYRDAIHHFVDCARTGAQPLITVESSQHVTAVLAAAHESARTGAPVKL
ncbi:Gfo/Idh/MocA family oxidoreductase [Nonomuraea sp. NPDC049152]|uniref:Gfo/Idh/MocA family protein n=1 Tax=Nonomuraea sp. NPDC049152 TaxID=3154350 RepID=UPI0033EA4080